MRLPNFLIACALLLFGLWLSGCVPKLKNKGKAYPSLPKTFGVADSGPDSLPLRTAFFADPLLRALIDTAIERNLDVQAAIQRMESVRGSVVLAKGNRLPDLGMNLSAGVRKFGYYTMDGVGNYDTKFSPNLNSKQQLPDPYPDFAPLLTTSWEIDIWKKLKARKKAAYHRFLATDAARKWVTTQLVADVASLYYQLQELDAEKKILERTIRLQEDAHDFVVYQKEAGLVDQLAVEIIHAQLLSWKEKEIEVSQLILEIETGMNRYLSRYPQPIPRDSAILTAPLLTDIQTGLPSALLNRRMDVVEAEQSLTAANADLEAARKAYLPTLSFSGFIGLQSFNPALLLDWPASVVYNVVGGLAAPLLNRRQLHTQLIQTNAEKQTAYLQYQKTMVNAFSEVFVNVNLQANLRLRFEQKSQEAEILTRSITTSNELFRSGRATYLELVNARRNALQAQLELVRLRQLQFENSIQLYKTLGGGWE